MATTSPYPPDGYRHSKVVMMSPVASANHTLPSWLKDLSQIPSIPVIGDPTSLLELYELKCQIPPSANAKEKKKARHFRNAYTHSFRMHAKLGDKVLGLYSLSILFTLFRPENRMLIQNIYEDWTSNASWQELAMIYRLDEYVGWLPGSLRERNHTPEIEKFWADLWEAWWASCFSEREFWDDGVDDLSCILRRIIEVKYRGVVERYSAAGIFIQTEPSIQIDKCVEESEPIDVHVEEVWTSNDDIRAWWTPHSSGRDKMLGHSAKIGSDITYFAQSLEDAVSSAAYYYKYGHKDAKRDISSYVYYSPSETGNYVRQRSFDSFVEICFGHPQPLSPTLHLIPLLRQIQQLRQEFINIGTCRVKDIIRMFWYEATLAAHIGERSSVLNALVFVISYCVRDFHRNETVNERLLESCLSLYDNVLISNDVDNDPINFILSHVPFGGGKLIIHDREVTSWGSEVSDIVLETHFDVKYITGDRGKSEKSFCPFEFISAWSQKEDI